MECYKPFGCGNKPIIFRINGCERMGDPTVLKDIHIKLKCSYFNAMLFGMKERFEEDKKPKIINALGTLSENYFMQRKSISLSVIDYEVPEERIYSISGLGAVLSQMAANH